MLLQDKVIIISGVGAGMGRRMAKLASAEGAKVGLASRNSAYIKSIAKESAYVKIIPIDMPLKKFTLLKGKLILELDASM